MKKNVQKKQRKPKVRKKKPVIQPVASKKKFVGRQMPPMAGMDGMFVSMFGPDYAAFMQANSDGRQTTPAAITPAIVALAAQVAGTIPRYVPVRPVAPAMRCHFNVRDYCDQHHGAEIVYGWCVWQSPKILEAEFHAIVRHKDGQEFCITKKPEGETTIVFFEDASRTPKFVVTDEGCVCHSFYNVISTTGKVYPKKSLVISDQLKPVKISYAC